MFHWCNWAELKSQKRAPQQELFKKQHHPNSIVYQISRSRNLNLEKSYKYGNESRVSADLFVCPLETRSWFLNSMQPCKLTQTHVREIYREREYPSGVRNTLQATTTLARKKCARQPSRGCCSCSYSYNHVSKTQTLSLVLVFWFLSLFPSLKHELNFKLPYYSQEQRRREQYSSTMYQTSLFSKKKKTVLEQVLTTSTSQLIKKIKTTSQFQALKKKKKIRVQFIVVLLFLFWILGWLLGSTN